MLTQMLCWYLCPFGSVPTVERMNTFRPLIEAHSVQRTYVGKTPNGFLYLASTQVILVLYRPDMKWSKLV